MEDEETCLADLLVRRCLELSKERLADCIPVVLTEEKDLLLKCSRLSDVESRLHAKQREGKKLAGCVPIFSSPKV